MAEVFSNVTAFNRYRRLVAERSKVEAEAAVEAVIPENVSQTFVQPTVRMTKNQLLTIAEERGIKVNEEMTKAEIVEALEPAISPKSPEEPEDTDKTEAPEGGE
jgi:hypothetical protein